jgi:cysteinyl-tRNA synthetase
MAIKYLGSVFDLHVGGIDLRFPHHENSRAMAMTATGERFAALWMHAAHLLVDGHKMSKSMKNEYTLDNLEARGVSPMDFRYYCMTLHYRTPMNFTWDGQAAAAKAFSRLKEAIAAPAGEGKAEKDGAETFRRRFREAVEDDLNVPRAVGVLHEAAHAGLPGGTLRELANEWDGVLGLGLVSAAGAQATAQEAGRGQEAAPPPEVIDLAARREAARKAKDFTEADALRAKIREAGYEIVDVKGGPARLRKL